MTTSTALQGSSLLPIKTTVKIFRFMFQMFRDMVVGVKATLMSVLALICRLLI